MDKSNKITLQNKTEKRPLKAIHAPQKGLKQGLTDKDFLSFVGRNCTRCRDLSKYTKAVGDEAITIFYGFFYYGRFLKSIDRWIKE